MKDPFTVLAESWDYYFSHLDIEPYEYDMYSKIIDKIRKKEFDVKQDKDAIVKLIHILQFECDEYEIIMLEKIQHIIDRLRR